VRAGGIKESHSYPNAEEDQKCRRAKTWIRTQENQSPNRQSKRRHHRKPSVCHTKHFGHLAWMKTPHDSDDKDAQGNCRQKKENQRSEV
jgi:hypothetical protein